MIRRPAWSRLLRAAMSCVTTSSQTRSSSSMRWMPRICPSIRLRRVRIASVSASNCFVACCSCIDIPLRGIIASLQVGVNTTEMLKEGTMAKPAEVTDAEWDQEVLKNQLPVLVDFWAPWCGPCRMVAPIVEELADEYSDKVRFYKINTDDNVHTASKYGIRSIPTLLVFKDGQIVDQLIGFRPKSDLKRSLEKALS